MTAPSTLPTTPPPPATTLGELRAQGHRSRTVKEELRENLLDALREGRSAFPGLVGFDDTVVPQLEAALLAGHDLVLLGERGQGKTRLMRTLADRKSTRLNSSHANISYAVFCLKKK